ncbi:hypothetical protein HOY80DRAFT_1111999 [Tuber brumale]|nr:hypothetical protein HOY80DRAFT_1111999 [Tuber brumale]
MNGNSSGPGYQSGGPHHGTQAQYHKGIPGMPAVTNSAYPPHLPPGLCQQVNATPPEVSPGEEIIIAFMGVAGAGKSYFIREVSGNSEVVVSFDLYSSDTPSFNDTDRSGTEVQREIAGWTSATYRES